MNGVPSLWVGHPPIFDNLRQNQREYPFYAFNPVFCDTGVAKYWRERTRRLQDATRLDDRTFAKRILVIEWFPYPSERRFYGPDKFEQSRELLCPSQQYSFQLVCSFLTDTRVKVLGMRSKRYWVAVDKRFEKVPFLNSCQNTRITPGNMSSGLFDEIVEIMKE